MALCKQNQEPKHRRDLRQEDRRNLKTPVGPQYPSPCHEVAGRKTNLRTALAKPSFSLLSVTALAWDFTSSLALPIAMEKPLLRNIRTSFGMSPMVAICSGGMFRSLDRIATTVPLLACGWVTSR